MVQAARDAGPRLEVLRLQCTAAFGDADLVAVAQRCARPVVRSSFAVFAG